MKNLVRLMAEHMAYSCWAADSAAAEIKDPFKKNSQAKLKAFDLRVRTSGGIMK